MKQYTILSFFVALILYSIFSPSCTRTEFRLDNRPFLDIYWSGNDVLSKEDIRVICMTMDRAQCYYDDGFLKMKVSDAKEINVSDRLFAFIVDIINNTNKIENRHSIFLKSGEHPYSCVAYAIAQLTGTPSFSEINDWITETYHQNGLVPTVQINAVLDHFLNGNFMGYSPSSLPDNMDWSYNRTVGIYRSGNGYGHMVNIIGRRINGDFLIQDFSSDTVETRNVFFSDMLYVYECWGIDSLAVEF